jgi:hypothetical protein
MKTYLDRDPPFTASNRRRHRQIHQRAGTTSMFIQRGTQRVHGRILWKRSTNLASLKGREDAVNGDSLENEDI